MDTVFDRALAEVGQDGKFQTLADIPHECEIPPKPDNVTLNVWKSQYIPNIVDEKEEEAKFSSCLVYLNKSLNNETTECENYKYDTRWYGSTVPSENNWVCSAEINVANVFAISRIGETAGSILFGWYGDVYGRRLTFMVSTIMLIVGRAISVLSNKSLPIFVCGSLISSLPSWSAPQSVSVISIEFSSPERRSTVTFARFASSTIALVIMPFVYWLLRDWKIFIIVTTAAQIPFLILSWRIVESPRWLWTIGKVRACVKELKRIGKINGKTLDTNTEQELLGTTPTGNRNSNVFGPFMLFSSWSLAFDTILQQLLWVFVTIVYTVLLISGGQKDDGNPFINFAWQAAAEMPGNFLGAWMADRIGRRKTGAVSFGAISILWALIALHEHDVPWLRYSVLATIFHMIIRLFATVAFYVITIFNMELYPTCLRQSGMALGNVVSAGASALAPYVVFLGHQVDIRLPGIILSIMAVIGLISSLLLPETLNENLPETLHDAQLFGSRQRKYYFSLQKRPHIENTISSIQDVHHNIKEIHVLEIE